MTMAVQSTIAAIQSAGAAAQEAATKTKTTSLGKDDFLKLLTTQMQQQDPTQPMDNTTFVAQLAQFSSLEQMNNVNDTLTKILAGQTTSLQATATGMVGKTAVFNSDQVTLTKGQPVTITAGLPEMADDMTMTIQDSTGTTVRTVALGSALAGTRTINWDGLDDNGDQLQDGIYTAQVYAKNLKGDQIAVTQTAKERITGVTFDNGVPRLLAGGISLSLSDISELDE
jgi:flagellar basal-body rod modification protein FlgD